jgi:hypothetical protein
MAASKAFLLAAKAEMAWRRNEKVSMASQAMRNG